MYYNSFKFYLSDNIDELLYILMYFFEFLDIQSSIVLTTINISYIYIIVGDGHTGISWSMSEAGVQ